ncbi:MAG: ferredoxin reductase, partial [Cellulomonadaceae bacterium]|nr:ferredoxin reductase [Cellulomonadaceae bacterium]
MASTDEARMLTVTARQNLTSDVVELTLRSLDGSPLPAWKPGAHIDLRLGADLVRQYSLIQTDDPSTWTIAVLVEPEGRGGSKLIGETVHVGSVVEVGGPRNHFPFVTGDRYLFIAGGIGVTPLIGMCRNAQADGADWRLVYAGRNRLKMAYVDQLEAEFPDRVEIYDLSEGQLFSVEDAISELDTDTHVYCCGPESLLDAVEDAMGAPSRLPYVHVERFRPREPAGFSENVEFTVYAQTSDVE